MTGGDLSRQRLLVIAISAGLLGSMMSSSMFGLALSDIARDLEVGYATLRWRNIVYWSVLAVGMPFFGRVVDRGNPRRHLLAGIALYTAAIGLTGLATSVPELLAFQVLHGLADALVFPAQSALIRRAVPPERVGWAFGWQTVVLAAGTLLGPVIGALLLINFGWRVPFLFLAVLGAAALAFAARVVPRQLPRGAGPGGGLPVVATLGLLGAFLSLQAALAVERGELALGLVAVAIGCGLVVAHRERRGPIGARLVPPGVWRNPVLLFTAVRGLCGNLGVDTVVTFGPSFLGDVHGMGPGMVGLVLLVSPGVVVLTATQAGRLSDRHSTACVVGGLASTAAGLLLLASLPVGAPFALFGLVAALIGAGVALFMPAQGRIALLATPEAETAASMAVYQMIGFLSGGFAGAAFGRLVERDDVGAATAKISVAGFHGALWICAAVAVLGAVTLLLHRREGRAKAPRSLAGPLT